MYKYPTVGWIKRLVHLFMLMSIGTLWKLTTVKKQAGDWNKSGCSHLQSASCLQELLITNYNKLEFSSNQIQ